MGGKTYRVLVINPGSTSTKIGMFDGDEALFARNVAHSAEELARYDNVFDQLPYRLATIEEAAAEAGVDLSTADAFVGRGGGLLTMTGGTYAVGDKMLEHATHFAAGVNHPAIIGSSLAHELATRFGKPAFIVNAPSVDELSDLARVTGIKGVYRRVNLHALNLKETAIRHAAGMGRRYEECSFVVCHIGGGISISAHDRGRMVDGFDIVYGEGPMAPTRSGAVPVLEVLNLIKEGMRREDVQALCQKRGGFVDLLGTSDAIEVTRRAEAGDAAAARAWNAMIYQICKCIGSMAAVLRGHVDGILLGGGMVHSEDLVAKIDEACSWIAPVSAYPGEFELEAMAAGAIRVLSGQERAREYTGMPVFQGFED